MNIGIAIDNWKLPTFKRHLDEAGFTFLETPGVTPDTLFLMVTTSEMEKLAAVVSAANTEARKKAGSTLFFVCRRQRV